MNVPKAAIEAAAKAIMPKWSMVMGGPAWPHGDPKSLACAAIEAAMPAIREAIANEIHAALCTDPNCEDVCVGAANAVEVVLEGFEL